MRTVKLGFLVISVGAIVAQAAASLSEAKYKVKVIPDARVRMRDGVEVAARITRPEAEGKFPAIMSYNPYRRLTTMKTTFAEPHFDHNAHIASYFAERGYVMVDYDVRGTGNSGGSSQEMYSDDERRDGYDMVEWIAAQPWCTGAVGMWGMSYGGVDTWQVAVQHPPHLKAVIVRSGTEDVYNDWTYPGGSPRSLFIFGNYAPQMVSDNFAPPDPSLTGDKWAEIWEEHLQHNVPWSIGFLKHQLDDSYWAARSVWPDYDRIKCPVFVIEGWADWYQTAELRAFSHLKVPKKAWIGPWAHYWPENAFPGPRIDGRPEYLKWFDQWLKGVNTGVMDEPPVTIFVRQYQEPAPMYMEDKGYWRSEKEWPPARAKNTAMYFQSGGKLSLDAGERSEEARDSYTYNPAVGVMSGILARGSVAPWAMPLDQRLDEAYSLTYTTSPLESDLEVTGNPSADLFISSSADRAYFEVKLCDVAPDGISKMIADGGLNATHRSSRSKPEPLKPGEVYELKIDLKSMSYVFPAGHRIRVDVASADFQNVWPSSKQGVNTVHRSGKYPSQVFLPVVRPQSPKLPAPDLKPSPNVLPEPDTVAKPEYTVSFDLINQTTTLTTANSAGRTTYTISSKNPGEAVMKATRSMVVSKQDSDMKVEAQCVTASDGKVFRHLVEVEVLVNGKRHFQKSWSVVVPREWN